MSSLLGIVSIAGVGIIGLILLVLMGIRIHNYRAHKYIVNIASKETGDLEKDRGRLFVNPNTFQTSFHLWNKNVFVPNIDIKKNSKGGEIYLEQIGNLQYIPMLWDLDTAKISPHLEVDIEFYTDGIRRSLERKQGEKGFMEKYGGFIVIVFLCFTVIIIFAMLFQSMDKVVNAWLGAADKCTAFAIQPQTVLTPSGGVA